MRGAKEGLGLGETQSPNRNGVREPAALPQWAIDAARPFVRLTCRALWGVTYRGFENVPERGGLIIAANHQTYVDPFWVGVPIKRPLRFLAWSEAFKWPLVGKPMELLGAWPIEVEKGDPTAYKRSLQWLGGGGAVVIFPEGGRAKCDGQLGTFKPGAMRMALEADVPVLPVTIRGGNCVWPRGRSWPRTGRVEVLYHPPHHPEIMPGEDTRQAARRETEKLRSIIEAALGEEAVSC